MSFGWRAVFVSAVLLSLGAWALVRRHVREPVASAPPATDWAGAVLLAAVVLALVLGMFQVHDSGIGSLPALALLGAAVLTAGGFLIVERRVSAPTLDLRLLRSVEFSASSDVGISAVAASKPGVGSLMSAYRTPATPPPGFA